LGGERLAVRVVAAAGERRRRYRRSTADAVEMQCGKQDVADIPVIEALPGIGGSDG
jgi:hypothetical protein